MDKERQSEHIDHALKELWHLHYLHLEEGSREDRRLGTIIKKLYELRDVIIYG